MTRPERHWEDMLTLTAIESLADTIVGLRLLFAGGKVENPYIGRQHSRITSCLNWLEGRITSEGFWPGIFSIMNLRAPLKTQFSGSQTADFLGTQRVLIGALNLMCPLLY